MKITNLIKVLWYQKMIIFEQYQPYCKLIWARIKKNIFQEIIGLMVVVVIGNE